MTHQGLTVKADTSPSQTSGDAFLNKTIETPGLVLSGACVALCVAHGAMVHSGKATVTEQGGQRDEAPLPAPQPAGTCKSNRRNPFRATGRERVELDQENRTDLAWQQLFKNKRLLTYDMLLNMCVWLIKEP